MKILNITKYFYPNVGGIESRNLEISRHLTGKYHKVYTLTSNHTGNLKNFEIYDGIEIIRHKILFTKFNDPFYPGEIFDILKLNYDLVHVDLPDPINSVFAFFASVLKSKPLYVTYHADIEKEELEKFPANLILNAYNLILKMVLWQARKIFVTSKEYSKSSKSLKNLKFEDECTHGKLVLSPNFINAQELRFDVTNKENRKKIEEIKEKSGLNNKKIILFVGRLVPYKGAKYLIEAFKKVEEEDDDTILIIIGSGPLKEELEDLAKGSKNIKFTGRVEDLKPYYSLCDVFVLPSVSRQEAFGIALIEAMFFGKPCITTDIDSGMKYVVDYGNAGILVKPKDASGLKNEIIKLIKDDGLRKEIGEKARKRVLEKFASRVVLEKFEKEINKLIPKT